MNRENEFVEVALVAAGDVIGPPLSIERGKCKRRLRSEAVKRAVEK